MKKSKKKRYPADVRYEKKLRDRIRLEVFSHYSNNNIRCNNCGETFIEVLTLDHIHDNGAEERRNTPKSGGYQWHRWLRRNNYPEGYQLLCWCCNFLKQKDKKQNNQNELMKQYREQKMIII